MHVREICKIKYVEESKTFARGNISSASLRRGVAPQERGGDQRTNTGAPDQPPTYITAASPSSAPLPSLAHTGIPTAANLPRQGPGGSTPAPPSSAAIAGDTRARHTRYGSRRAPPLVAFPCTATCGPPRPLRQPGAPNPTLLAPAAACGVPSPSSAGTDRPPTPPPPHLRRRGGSPPQLFPLAGQPPEPEMFNLAHIFLPPSFE